MKQKLIQRERDFITERRSIQNDIQSIHESKAALVKFAKSQRLAARRQAHGSVQNRA